MLSTAGQIGPGQAAVASFTFAQAEAALAAAGVPAGPIPLLAAVCAPESGWDTCAQYPSTTNCSPAPGSAACGAWQINPCPGPQASDLQTNAQYAAQKFQDQGMSAWASDAVVAKWQEEGAPVWPDAATVQGWLTDMGLPTGGAPGSTSAPAGGSQPAGQSSSSQSPFAAILTALLGGLTPGEIVIRSLEVIGGSLLIGTGLVALGWTIFSKPVAQVTGAAASGVGKAQGAAGAIGKGGGEAAEGGSSALAKLGTTAAALIK